MKKLILSIVALAAASSAFAADIYVVKGNPNASEPYSTLETAASNVMSAVSIATDGATIHVGDGVYPVSTPLTISNAVKIVGNDADPSRVMVSNTTSSSDAYQERRVFLLDHAGAKLSGLTIAQGEAYNRNGGNVNISDKGGTLSNCVVVGGYARNNGQAGNAYANAGLVTHCRFIGGWSNSASVNWSSNRSGSCLFEGTARVENCLFERANQSVEVHMIGVKGSAILRNCSIVNASQTSTSASYGGSYPLFISNSPTVENVVIAGVTNAAGVALGPVGSSNILSHCALDVGVLPNGTCAAVTTAAFADYASGDYTPAKGSVLYGGGFDYEGMAATDLSGKPRKQGRHIDIGCFESQILALSIRLR